MKKVVIPVSGGLDSVTLLHYLADQPDLEIFPVYIDYGQRHAIEQGYSQFQVDSLREWKDNIHPMKFIDMTFLGELLLGASSIIGDVLDVPTVDQIKESQTRATTYIPYRNMIFISTLMSYAESIGAFEVYFGSINEQAYTPSWDTTEKFTKAMNSTSNLNSEKPVKVISPFSSLTKGDLVNIGMKSYAIDYSKTWSSYEVAYDSIGRTLAISTNPSSADRIRGFASLGIEDPIDYAEPIDWQDQYDAHFKMFNIKSQDEILSIIKRNIKSNK